jgi:hypothetical protein
MHHIGRGGQQPIPARPEVRATKAAPGNESEISVKFVLLPRRKFSWLPGQRRAAAGWCNMAPRNSPQKPEDSSKLRQTRRQDSYADTIRTGCFAMIRKREKPIDPMPTMSPGEYEAAVDAFIRNKGITRCPTACLVRTQASVPAADRAALERYEAGREQSRRESLAAVPRSIGVFSTPPNAC